MDDLVGAAVARFEYLVVAGDLTVLHGLSDRSSACCVLDTAVPRTRRETNVWRFTLN